MQIVIDIPDEVKEVFDSANIADVDCYVHDYDLLLGKAIKNGTPLSDNTTVVSFTPLEIKMLHTALHHQWVNMTDDNGQAVNCRQESADCVYNLLKKFEALNAETKKEG